MFFGIISTFITTPVLAAPSYLKCKTTDKDGKVQSFSVKLDETNGKITHTEDGESFNAEGFFSAKTISYQQVIGQVVGKTVQSVYTIDRTTLKIINGFISPGLPKNTLEGMTSKGSCEVVEVKGRKI